MIGIAHFCRVMSVAFPAVGRISQDSQHAVGFAAEAQVVHNGSTTSGVTAVVDVRCKARVPLRTATIATAHVSQSSRLGVEEHA